MRSGSARFAFANQLRGVAALCVVAAHLGQVFWVKHQLVSDATFSIAPSGTPPAYATFGSPWLDLGAFGVALFFLISGFVIPLSLQRQDAAGFLIARAFRIFPTYWLALGVEIAVIAWSASYWGQPFTDSAWLILGNALLLNVVAFLPSIDLVNWTLIVEVTFYVGVALLAVPLRRANLAVVFWVAAGILGVSSLHDLFGVSDAPASALWMFESTALYIVFMLIGVTFSFHARGLLGAGRLGASVLALFTLFVICWLLTFFRVQFPSFTVNYGYALLVFSTLYVLRDRIHSVRVLDYFAAISYPLYLVHSLVGYTLMQILIGRHAGALVATAASLALVIALATLLHHVIELPSQAFGKSLAQRVRAAGDPARSLSRGLR